MAFQGTLSVIEEVETSIIEGTTGSASSSPVSLTPISSITRRLNCSSISDDEVSPIGTAVHLATQRFRKQIFSKNSLFRNAFKIKGTPEITTNKAKLRTRRLVGMASEYNSSPELGSKSPTSRNQNVDCAAIFNPDAQNSTPHKMYNPKSNKARFPLEECDPNSQDSGYGATYSEEKRKGFQFAEPLRAAPRRFSLESPMKSPIRSSPLRKRAARSALFRSLSSGYESDAMDDLIDMDGLDEGESKTRLPNDLLSLISGDIVNEKSMEMDVTTTPEPVNRSRNCQGVRRSLSMQCKSLNFDEEMMSTKEAEINSTTKKVRSCLFRSPNATSSVGKLGFDDNPRSSLFDSPKCSDSGFKVSRKFKRPEPPTIIESPSLVKRSRKCTSFNYTAENENEQTMNSPPSVLQRSFSESEAHASIKSAVHRSITNEDLTGDFSKSCILPLANGRHEDLKSISPEVLSKLIDGDFNDLVSDYKIIDCRYPYEFEGGHIKGAVNLYTKELIEEFLMSPKTSKPEIEPECNKRSILVFHCEFSWERGPNLSRFLRSMDRQRNKEHYPALHYPEVYLLHGGYQKFFNEQKHHCHPQGYRTMRDPDHEADLKQFRNKSKSWQGEKAKPNVTSARANLKRLGLLN